MGWTVLPYLLATGGSVVDTDMNAVADSVFSQRSSHYIFTEDYNLGAVVGMGATITRLNVQIQSFNAIGRFNVWPLMLSSANILSPPRIAWYWPQKLPLPKNEELTFKVTDGASENAMAHAFIFTPGHGRNVPANDLIIPVRATASVTQVANGWSAPAALTMEQNLRGGVYSIIGAEMVCSASALFRFIFPAARSYKGRFLRPGWLIQQAIGDLPEARMHIDPYYLGEWGRFHTFELPQVEVYGAAATSTVTAELRLWLAWLGSDPDSLLRSWAGQGWS